MSKHCILYHTNFGRNDGGPLYYTFNLKKMFGEDNIKHLMPHGDISGFGKFDYWWWVDYGEDGLPTDKSWKIPLDGGRRIYVCSDAHIDEAGKEFRYNKAREFDYVFFNQERFVEEYKALHPEWNVLNEYVGFLPHAAEPEAYPYFEIIKKYDVCFIGHLQEVKNYNGIDRVSFLDHMFKAFPNFFFGTRSPLDPTKNLFEDASKRFCESKVVLNISIKDDINMRLFETLSSGSFLLTNYLPTLHLIGEDGKHFVTYKTLEEAVEKARYYIEHDEEREKIAQAGHAHFMENHTYRHRIEKVLSTIKEVEDGKH